MTAVTRGARAGPAFFPPRGDPGAEASSGWVTAPSPRATPTAVATVPSMPAWPRLEYTRRPDREATPRSKARTGLEAPSTSGPDVAEATARARSIIVRPDSRARSWSMRAPTPVERAWTLIDQSARRPDTGPSGASRSATTTEALPETSTHGACGSTTTTRTSGRARSAWMGRDRVGRPVTTTVSTWRARSEETMACSKGVTPPPAHAPEAGSARRGKPEACDHCAARGEAPSPATMRPARAWPTTSSHREGAGSAGRTRVGRGTNEAGASSPGRPPSLGAGAWGVRGSRKATLSWTGPGAPVGAPVAAARARESWPTREGEGSCGSRSTQARAWVLKRRAWSVAWEAPTPRSSPGRSALTTRRGRRAWEASRTAGVSSATAVPEVTITAGSAPVRARPTAAKPAPRSSRTARACPPKAPDSRA